MEIHTATLRLSKGVKKDYNIISSNGGSVETHDISKFMARSPDGALSMEGVKLISGNGFLSIPTKYLFL